MGSWCGYDHPLGGCALVLTPPLGALVPCGGMQDGVTAAYMAAWNGHVECLKVLQEAGADLGAAQKVRLPPV